jgi:hypothetical protein
MGDGGGEGTLWRSYERVGCEGGGGREVEIAWGMVEGRACRAASAEYMDKDGDDKEEKEDDDEEDEGVSFSASSSASPSSLPSSPSFRSSSSPPLNVSYFQILNIKGYIRMNARKNVKVYKKRKEKTTTPNSYYEV